MKKIQAILCAVFTATASIYPNNPLLANSCCEDCAHHVNANNPEQHSLSLVSRNGSFVRIEDGSHWEMAEADTKTVLHWRANDVIIIGPNPSFFSSYYYKYSVRNLTTGTSAIANLMIGPIIGGCSTKQVVGLNYEDGRVLLNDKSAWLVSDKYQNKLQKWEEKDYVIIGVNSNSHYRNILINVTLDQYIEAENY